MFLLVASAIAGTLIGWPCQRLNWGWRNVWTTCSIYSWAPAGTATDNPNDIPTGFRRTTAASPLSNIAAGGWYMPTATTSGGVAAVPQYFCTQAAATGTGATAGLRNRCRRAIDAYGSLVTACGKAAALTIRGPNSVSPDWQPADGHLPHVTNVKGLSIASGYCNLAPWDQTTGAVPSMLKTPATSCPGLLGWFTVVFNACGFTNAPGMGPNGAAPYSTKYFPLGAAATPEVLGGYLATPVAVGTTAGNVGIFCNTAAGTPSSWNQAQNAGAFKTSRCRKALDQFGRTASRCHFSLAATAPGPAQAGGYSDPLRVLAVGVSTINSPVTPLGMNAWAPICN